MIENSNLLLKEPLLDNQNQNDLNARNLQQNLIRMGFDLIMINKIISIFKIRTENEALDYLIKTEDGMWNHPFIPKEVNPDEENNGILEQPKAMMTNVITRINSLKIANPIKERTSSLIASDFNSGEIKIEDDICEICGESKDCHKIKEFIEPDSNNNINNNDNNNILNNNNLLNCDENNEQDIIIDNKIDIKKEKEEEKEEENANPNECQICMDELENPVEIEKCKHKFCQECFNSYLVNLINNNRIDQIPCPKNKCPNNNLTEEFFSQYLSEQQYFKFRQFKSQNEIARDSKKIFCPLCDSYASIDGITEKYDSNNPNYKKSTLKCQKGHEFCSCGRPLHENECYHDEKEFNDFLTQEKIKKCPKCGFLIKKNRGCNHMTCGNPICRYEFCWLCMKEAVPNHFDYGPCAGKQFFDPESFSYRLEQNHPCLYCIYSFFNLVLLIVGFIGVPGLGLSYMAYHVIFETNHSNPFNKKLIKLLTFPTYICLFISLESIIYMAWGLVISVALIILGFTIISIVLDIIKGILKCLFCCCSDNDQPDLIAEVNDIELGNNYQNI